MFDLCLQINLNIPGFEGHPSIHAHLIITPFENIFFKIYFQESSRLNEFVRWVESQNSFNQFGSVISISRISNNHVNEIFLNNSKIKALTFSDNLIDQHGRYIGIKFNEVTFTYKSKSIVKLNGKIISELFLDNHAYDLINSFINIDAFWSDPKSWKSVNTKNENGKYLNFEFLFDFYENAINDSSSYPNLIERQPRILIHHDNISFSEVLNLSNLFVSILSFYLGHDIDYNNLRHLNIDFVTENHKIGKSKEKILRKNLQRFNIDIGLYELIESLSLNAITKVNLISELVFTLNQSLQFDGTNKFMLLFTIIEKLRNELLGSQKSDDKFSFTNKKEVNEFLKKMLLELKNKVIDSQKDQFEQAIEGKITNIKYLPQKNQFSGLFSKLNLQPSNFELDFNKVIEIRGEIFHGKFIDPQDPIFIELNSKMSLFTGNLVFNYLTLK